jgi:hypothetical protein
LNLSERFELPTLLDDARRRDVWARFDRRIDTTALNDFNLLPRGTDGCESKDSLVDLRGAFDPRRSLQDDAVPEQVDPARVSIQCS